MRAALFAIQLACGFASAPLYAREAAPLARAADGGETGQPAGLKPDDTAQQMPADSPVSAQKRAPEPAPKPAPQPARQIAFEARELSYDDNKEVVTARGTVVLRSEDSSVRADLVRWDRRAGNIVASGNVRFVNQYGDQIFSQSLSLNDSFETGAMEELLIALRAGGRLAAQSAMRGDNKEIVLKNAAYSACGVIGVETCASPSWRITADRIAYGPGDNRIKFKGAVLELLGARLLPLPGLTIRSDGRAESGLLIPDLRISRSNGLEVSGRYYWRIANNKDLTLGTHLFTGANPLVSAEWRHLTGRGAYQITGYATQSRRISSFTGVPTSKRDLRGYVFANGRFQFDPRWSVTASIRRASDRTFLRRYDISRDDRLRSTVNLERIDDKSYLTIAGWSTQSLRLGTAQREVPLALPAIDYRRLIDTPALGGKIELQANSLNILRREGQDTQRAFASARWDLRKVTGWGQLVTVTALARGDLYHSDGNNLTATAIYRGNPGWQARGIALGALDIEWPFVGEAFGGTQIFKPRVQIVATPNIRNLAVPNEDSRAIDLEDSNLFSLNRFPGYDRFEQGARITYGLDWELHRPNWRIKTSIGQSYRFQNDFAIFPDGTGLSQRVSDVVGRTEVRFRDLVKFTHRFRLDKDNFAVRRNEVDATLGSPRTYLELGYVRLNRDIVNFEDLQDREELRMAGRVAFGRNWSAFGSGVFNLTNRKEDPSLTSDGFEPIRTRLGVAYDDGSLEFGLTWRRDYITAGDAKRGDTFQVVFTLKNLGLR